MLFFTRKSIQFEGSHKIEILIVSLINFLYACLMVFNTTFNTISVTLWPSVLLVEEIGGPGENH